jgi:hypothetical protein
MRRTLSWAICLTSSVVPACGRAPVNIGNDAAGASSVGVHGDAGSGDATGGLENAPGGGRPSGGAHASTGGASSTGGKTHDEGGTGTDDPPPNGGDSETGGASATGGAPGSGGKTGSGGSRPTGGTAAGGKPGSGGSRPTGGTAAGGSVATGGMSGSSGEAGAPNPPLEPAPGQRILFELAYSNFAWGPRSEGMFITADGNVYDYVTPEQGDGYFGDLLLRKDPMTEEEVTAKYGPSPELVGTVPESELLATYALVAEARGASLFVRGCSEDGGVAENVAWLYDPSTALYSPVLLGTTGDTCVASTSAAADTIMDWLCRINTGSDCADVLVTDMVDCDGATCSDEPPSCPASQRPSVVDGCWGDCVPNTWCKQARSCDDCTEYQVCIVTPDGKSHCSDTGCRYENCPSTFACGIREDIDVTCDCAGAEICAGGAQWCHQLEPSNFSCTAP